MPWGQASIAKSYPWRAHLWYVFSAYLFGASTAEVEYFNYWNRTLTNQYTAANLQSGDNDRFVPFALLYLSESDPQVNYRTALPYQLVANAVDTDTQRSLDMWVSRTGWTSSSDSLVFMQAYIPTYNNDHIGQGAAGSYKVYKNGWTLVESNNSTNNAVGTGYGGSSNGTVNMPFFGTGSQLTTSATGVGIDRSKSDDATNAYSYVRVNSRAAYLSATKASRVLRYLVHFKKTGTQDYLIDYDDLGSSSGISKTVYMLYDKSVSTTMTSGTLPSLVWTKTGSARVSTKIVLPSGTGALITTPQYVTTFAHQVPICASLDGASCDSRNTAAEFLFVHRVSSNTSDSMPTVGLLGTIDANFRGVQIEGTDPKVAIFPKLGVSRTSTSFTTTHTGTAQIMITGLETGTYTLARDATPVCSDVTVDENEALYCETTAGAITVTAGPKPVAPIRRAGSSGDGIGNNTMAAWLVDWIMSTRPYAQGTNTANTFAQLETKTWASIKRW